MFDTDEYELKMQAAIEHFEHELAKIRTGRAHPGMLDGIKVVAYGTEMPLNQVANITAPEAQLLQITPFDPSNIQAIAASIRNDQGLGLNPSDDGRVVRVPVPPLTEDRRRQLARQAGEKVEEARIALRNVRQDGLKDARAKKEAKELSEDDVKLVEKEFDRLMQEAQGKLDEAFKAKEERHPDNIMSVVPTHIGYILDGNRRWAKKHGLPTYEGHLAGYNALHEVIEATSDAGVKYISLYTFSTQNWTRAAEEVQGIMSLIRRLFKSDIKRLVKEDYRVVVLGSREGVPADIAKYIDEAEERSKNGTKATLAICFNYGGQEEIVRAARRLIEQKMSTGNVTLESFAAAIDHPEVPPCDLIVRTSGEQRLSDFMLWRSAYSEFLFLDKYWPEMTKQDITDILEEYTGRKRRFGG